MVERDVQCKIVMSIYTLAVERTKIMLSKGHMVPSEEKKVQFLQSFQSILILLLCMQSV